MILDAEPMRLNAEPRGHLQEQLDAQNKDYSPWRYEVGELKVVYFTDK